MKILFPMKTIQCDLSNERENQPENLFMQNKAKNFKFFKKDDLTLARNQFPTSYIAQKTKWGHWSFNLTFCPPWGH